MVYLSAKLTIIPFVKLYVRKINGLENLPKKTAFIAAANHTSYMDHLMIAGSIISHLDRKVHFLAKKEHFDNFLKKAWHDYAGAIPLDRQKGGQETLKWAVRALREGKIIAIHPEGTRSLTGKLQRAKTGVARLAVMSRAPVIPIGLIGTFEILPKGKYMPKFKKAVMKQLQWVREEKRRLQSESKANVASLERLQKLPVLTMKTGIRPVTSGSSSKTTTYYEQSNSGLLGEMAYADIPLRSGTRYFEQRHHPSIPNKRCLGPRSWAYFYYPQWQGWTAGDGGPRLDF